MNQLCDNMIDKNFEHSVVDTADKVVMTTTKMRKITKMSIVYIVMIVADC